MSTSYIPLSQRGTWTGIEPIAQDDGPNPLCAIMYANEYRDAMDYFRAIRASGEQSERVLELTETIIRDNPAHYTVWQYRLATLLALGKDLKEELELMNEFARINLKSYQVWHHRLLLLTHISPAHPRAEIDFIHDSLIPDSKNYHTWAYLHWLYSHFSTLGRITEQDWGEEIRWCEELLRVDGRNNSAWGWRWFLMVSRPGAEGSKDGGEEEISYTLKAIHRIPHNVSAWNYLRGLLKHLNQPFTPLLPAIQTYTGHGSTPVKDFSYPIPLDPLSRDTPLPISHALEFLADALAEQGKTEEAAEVFKQLGQEVDRMRAGYWDYRKQQIL
ncbi:hypothetical protein BCR39DRAFT_510606 [Naematelia encephala]|uniref:Protein farnesyltransferase/geranylgeranyltransferase type-1 subunit alpha n=1 Tax=Naematelia encephala TaxID=71784 RepID=A0A1Y2BLA3_9TREE|nr:hypothetical protein BCR39DRAFT_510606 [Naematelia encephala]